MKTETIAAIASPPGQGAIALIRLSGSESREIAGSVFSVEIREPRQQVFGRILDSGGDPIDEVLLTFFPAPHSYTGEDVIEISCHGGMLVTQKVLERVLQAGARPAEAGEFSQRAFLNGKMDLTQAEAVMDLISAQTELALKAANEQLSGRLGDRLMDLRKELIAVIAQVEAYIDFPEDDIDPETGEAFQQHVAKVKEATEELLQTADQGRILREGVRTVICGAPNVGKSSLLNVLLGFDRAIVSERAGTTRDTIEEVINLRGIPIRLIDTAGVRESSDDIERMGIARTESQIENAELVLEMIDVSQPRNGQDAIEIPDSVRRRLRILNKSDLGRHSDWEESEGVPFSCTERIGVDALSDAILDELGAGEERFGSQMVAINARHKNCLQRARNFLQAAGEKLKSGESPEFIALELREALEAIGEVVGKTDVEEILGEIFAKFCIGK